jgi:hypothetical protein
MGLYLIQVFQFFFIGPSARVTLLKIKKSFHDTDNVLYDWINGSSNGHNDHCAWRGVTCNNAIVVKL